MGSFSLIHWIILGIIILLLFGGNRFSAMMSDVAKGLKSFKQGLSEEDNKPAERPQDPRQLPRESSERPIDITPTPEPRRDPTSPPDDRTTG
jgi:sec-independent protein translocase protein TatA